MYFIKKMCITGQVTCSMVNSSVLGILSNLFHVQFMLEIAWMNIKSQKDKHLSKAIFFLKASKYLYFKDVVTF